MLSSILIAGFLVADYFTGRGVDESVIYHVLYGLDGAGFRAYVSLALIVLLYLVTSIYLLYIFIKKNVEKECSKKNGKVIWIIGIFILLGSILSNPMLIDLVDALGDVNSKELASTFDYTTPAPVKISKKKNIIYLYLEGVERTYFDQEKFPGLMPNLIELEKQFSSFTNIEQTYGAGWTIAGMVASQCGIPLARDMDGNAKFSKKFLPKAYCLGDALRENGYNLSFMGGAPIKFAGKGDFYKSHGFSSIYGLEELEKILPADADKSGWGVHDDDLYKLAEQKIKLLQKTTNPYGLFLLTVDTHHPLGYLTKNCNAHNYGDGNDNMLNSLHCADKMAGDFIRSLLKNGVLKDTILIVASDHLALPSSTTGNLNKLARRNLFMVFEQNKTPELIAKKGSTLDITPTIMSFLGVTTTGWGFGKNLLEKSQTIIEKYGDSVNKYLKTNISFIASFWDHPSLTNDMKILAKTRDIRIGQNEISYPVLMRVDDKLNIIDYVEVESGNANLANMATWNIPFNQYFIWVDSCPIINRYVELRFKYNSSDYCILKGRPGSILKIKKIEEYTVLTAKKLMTDLNFKKVNPMVYRIRQNNGRRAIERENEVTYQIYDPSINSIRYINSAGFKSGSKSYGFSLEEKDRWPWLVFDSKFYSSAIRGVSILGFKGHMKPVQLGHLDTCDPINPFVNTKEKVAKIETVNQTITKFSSSYDAIAVIVDDSALCGDIEFGKKEIARLFKDSPLVKWRDISYRSPYIAYITQGKIKEYSADSQKSLRLEIYPERHNLAVKKPSIFYEYKNIINLYQDGMN